MHIIGICLIYLGCLCSIWIGAQEENREPSLPSLSESEVSHFQLLVQGNNRFAFDLYQRLKNQPGNLYFSPYSIVATLAMASIGAKGETAQQFQHAFRYSLSLLLFMGDLNALLQNASSSKNGGQVVLANAIWLDKNLSVLPSFNQTLLRDFRTNLQMINFANELGQSIQKVNQWILQQTNGKIYHMLSSQDATVKTRMILTSAAYMKGQWIHPFDQRLTKRLPFHLSAQRTVLVEMMQNTSDYLFREGELWDMLVLPYEYESQGVQLSMVIFLPKQEVSLNELEKNFTWENWQQWKSQLKNQAVNLSLPRFRIDKRMDLETTLKSLGLSLIFSPEADFSGITGEKNVYLNQVIHKAFIRAEEKGTEIAGTAYGKIEPAVIPNGKIPYPFVADRPFVFVIWDQKTDSILFMGRISMPTTF